MAYFFRQIETRASSEKSERREVIYNLDEFHVITRLGSRITASRTGEKPILIANCRSEAEAKYIIECILNRKEVNSRELEHIWMRAPF